MNQTAALNSLPITTVTEVNSIFSELFTDLDQRAYATVIVHDWAAGKLAKAVGTITVSAYASIVSQVAASQTITIDNFAAMNGVKASGIITVTNYAQMIAAKASGDITVTDYLKLTAAAATGTITITDYTQLAGKTFTVNGNDYTEGVHFVAETDEATTATNLEAVLDIDTDITCSVLLGAITITASADGAAGNSIGLSTNATGGFTLSAATLLGGQDNAIITVDGVAYVQGTDFTAETSNDVTATNIATAVALGAQDAAAVGAVVTVTAAATGTAGNSIGTSSSTAIGLTFEGATLTGGQAHAAIIVDGVTYTQGTDFTAETSNDITATNLAAAIAGGAQDAAAVGAVVTVTAAVAGVAGNSIGTTSTVGIGFTIGGATLSGGLAIAVIVVDGNALTAGSDFVAETDEATTATNLAAAIHALANVNASAVGAVVTIVAAVSGTAGNSITVASTAGLGFTLGGAHLAGGVDGKSITVDGNALVAGVDFVVTTSNEVTAENIKTAVHGLANVNATRTGAIVTVEAATAGTAGNAITMAKTAVGVSLSGATLSGGQAAVVITLQGTALTESSDFTAETDNATTATNLGAALDGVAGFDVEVVGNAITIYYTTPGTGGNAKTLASTVPLYYAISGATFSGGVAATYTQSFPGAQNKVEALLDVTAVAGTNPTIDVTPQYTFDEVTWFNSSTAFAQAAAITHEMITLTTTGAKIRFKIVLGGTNPIASLGVSSLAK